MSHGGERMTECEGTPFPGRTEKAIIHIGLQPHDMETGSETERGRPPRDKIPIGESPDLPVQDNESQDNRAYFETRHVRGENGAQTGIQEESGRHANRSPERDFSFVVNGYRKPSCGSENEEPSADTQAREKDKGNDDIPHQKT